MAKDKKGGLAILIAGKPTDEEPVEDDYEGEDVPTDEIEAEAEPYEEAEYPEFDIPEGLDLADMEEGDEKEVLAVVRKKAEGSACIVSVDGVDLAGGGAEEVPEAPAEAPPPPTAAPPGPMDIRGRAMGAGLM